VRAFGGRRADHTESEEPQNRGSKRGRGVGRAKNELLMFANGARDQLIVDSPPSHPRATAATAGQVESPCPPALGPLRTCGGQMRHLGGSCKNRDSTTCTAPLRPQDRISPRGGAGWGLGAGSRKYIYCAGCALANFSIRIGRRHGLPKKRAPG
jgi:hypothetical protein